METTSRSFKLLKVYLRQGRNSEAKNFLVEKGLNKIEIEELILKAQQMIDNERD